MNQSAFATIHENYYYVFVSCTLFFLVIAYFYFPETRLKSLEEIAAAFGDKVVLVDETAIEVEHQKMEAKAGVQTIEKL